MTRNIRTLLSNHYKITKTALLIIMVLAIVAIPLAIAYNSHTMRAQAKAAASGTATVEWGNPYLNQTVSYGKGWEKLIVRGAVYPTPYTDGYYTYHDARLRGSLHVEWSNNTETYVLDVSFSRGTNYAYGHDMPTKIVPIANALAVTGMDYDGTLVVNGVSSSLDGLAALITDVPGAFGFQGAHSTVGIVFYISPNFQVEVVWSEANQTIRGVFHPACGIMTHSVRLVK